MHTEELQQILSSCQAVKTDLNTIIQALKRRYRMYSETLHTYTDLILVFLLFLVHVTCFRVLSFIIALYTIHYLGR